MEFRFVGFDVRVWPLTEGFYVDDTGWDINYEAELEIESKFKIVKNTWQLWESESAEEFVRLCDYIQDRMDINISTVEVPLDIAQMHDQVWQASYSNAIIDLSRFIVRSLDICDYDGWFSAMHHPDFYSVSGGLLDVNQIDRAVELVAVANEICIEHAPHTVVKIRTLK